MYSNEQKSKGDCRESKNESLQSTSTHNNKICDVENVSSVSIPEPQLLNRVLLMAAQIELAEVKHNVDTISEKVKKITFKEDQFDKMKTLEELHSIGKKLLLAADQLETVHYRTKKVTDQTLFFGNDLLEVAREMRKVGQSLQRMGSDDESDLFLSELKLPEQQQHNLKDQQGVNVEVPEPKLVSKMIEKFERLENPDAKVPVAFTIAKKCETNVSDDSGSSSDKPDEIGIPLTSSSSEEQLLDDQDDSKMSVASTSVDDEENYDGDDDDEDDDTADDTAFDDEDLEDDGVNTAVDDEESPNSDDMVQFEFHWDWTDVGYEPYTEDVELTDNVEDYSEQDVASYSNDSEEADNI